MVNVFPKLSETFIAGELAELVRRGIEVRILSLRRPTDKLQHDLVARAGLSAHAYYEPSEFRRRLRHFEPELIHAHFATEPAASARQLSEELGVPFTITAHGYDIYRRPPMDFAARAAAAAALITVSEANARYLAGTFGVPRSHIHVIPCGVDTSRFRPGGHRPRPRHIVCVARLVPVKNLGLLLEACARLRARGVDFHCVIVGEGPCREELLAARSRLHLESVVELTGAAEQAEVCAWWQRASVALLTSEREGMPVCLMEAAACGVPAVATAVGGVPELIEDGVTGLLAPAGDAHALADRMERLLLDPWLAARLGAAARRRAESCYGVTGQVSRLLRLWADLVPEETSVCPSP